MRPFFLFLRIQFNLVLFNLPANFIWSSGRFWATHINTQELEKLAVLSRSYRDDYPKILGQNYGPRIEIVHFRWMDFRHSKTPLLRFPFILTTSFVTI